VRCTQNCTTPGYPSPRIRLSLGHVSHLSGDVDLSLRFSFHCALVNYGSVLTSTTSLLHNVSNLPTRYCTMLTITATMHPLRASQHVLLTYIIVSRHTFILDHINIAFHCDYSKRKQSLPTRKIYSTRLSLKLPTACLRSTISQLSLSLLSAVT
jgi:hypothetical protein